MYEIVYSEKALKQIKKLEKDTQKRIIKSLEKIRIRPYNFVKKVVGTKYFRLRAGDYRIILDIKDKNLLVYIVNPGRRNIYK